MMMMMMMMTDAKCPNGRFGCICTDKWVERCSLYWRADSIHAYSWHFGFL